MPVVLRWLLRLGPTNPITVRLVQNGSRRARHFYIRAIYLGVMIAVLLYALLLNASGASASYQKLALAGSAAFTYVAYLQIALICILAPVFMAGAIAQEADPRTWDILLATPLGAGEIVLGNLFGRLFFILALLFASLPLFAVTQYFGGVPGSSIFASYLIAAAAALLVGAMAIALSVSRLVGKRAVFTFYIAVITYLIVTIAADSFLSTAGVTWMTALNPFLALRALLDPTGYPRAAPGTYTGLASWFLERPVTTWCVLAIGVSMLLMSASTITVRFGGIAGFGSGNRDANAAPWYRKLFGFGAKGAENRAPRSVWHNPISWREAAARNATFGRILSRWSFIVMGVLFGAGLLWAYHTAKLSAATFRQALLFTAIGELIVIVLVAINMSATAVSREREDGTLDLILTTPITPSQYLSGKLQGIVAYLLPMLAVPIITLALPAVYVALNGLGNAAATEVAYNPPANMGRWGAPPGGGAAPAAIMVPTVLPEAILSAPVVLIPFVAFCVIVGMQWSLKSKGTIGSVMWTVGVIAAIAGVTGLCAWNASSGIDSIGPVLGAMSPFSAVYACVTPEEAMNKAVISSMAGARAALIVGAFIAAGVYLAVVYGIRASMTRNFDMTVRKLAGTK